MKFCLSQTLSEKISHSLCGECEARRREHHTHTEEGERGLATRIASRLHQESRLLRREAWVLNVSELSRSLQNEWLLLSRAGFGVGSLSLFPYFSDLFA